MTQAMTPPSLGTWELPYLSHDIELQQLRSFCPLGAEAEWIGLRIGPRGQLGPLARRWCWKGEVLLSLCRHSEQEVTRAQEFCARKSRCMHSGKQRQRPCEQGRGKGKGEKEKAVALPLEGLPDRIWFPALGRPSCIPAHGLWKIPRVLT